MTKQIIRIKSWKLSQLGSIWIQRGKTLEVAIVPLFGNFSLIIAFEPSASGNDWQSPATTTGVFSQPKPENYNRNSVLDVFVFQRRKGMRARLLIEEVNKGHFTHRRDQASQTVAHVDPESPVLEEEYSQQSDTTIEVELGALRGRINILEAQLQRYVAGMNDKLFLSQESSVYKALVKNYSELDDYKKQLQNDVAIMRYGQGPRHAESYYEGKVNDLNRKIRRLARKVMPPQEELTLKLFNSFKTALGRFPDGNATVKVMDSAIEGDTYALFSRNRSRGNMYMHLLSLAIYERVLTSFAFGMDAVVMENLDKLQNIILDEGCPSKLQSLMKRN